MTEAILKKTRFAAGTWDGLLIAATPDGTPPALEVRLNGAPLPAPTVAAMATQGRWRVSFDVPATALGDAPAVIEILSGDSVLAQTVIAATDADAEDLRTDLQLMRAELDQVKAVLRRHLHDRPDQPE